MPVSLASTEGIFDAILLVISKDSDPVVVAREPSTKQLGIPRCEGRLFTEADTATRRVPPEATLAEVIVVGAVQERETVELTAPLPDREGRGDFIVE